MKNMSTGTGLALLAAAIVAYPFANSLAPNANAVGVGVGSVAPAVAAAALAQDPPAPTIVWYGVGSNGTQSGMHVIWRAWSDGTVEFKHVPWTSPGCSPFIPCTSGWIIASTAQEGLAAAADLNFDEAVDGVDLGALLAKWGPAPRNPVPPSDCPLALINP